MSEPGFAANPHPLSEFDLHLINHGNHERLFEVLGCHLFDQGARFAVWAPNAQAVSVIGDFNGWAIGATPLRKHDTCGVCRRITMVQNRDVFFLDITQFARVQLSKGLIWAD